MVYRLTLAYRGTHYAGWQRQPNAMTVQQRLEEALAALTGEDAPVVGASRTDTGVHAAGQVAHLRLDRPLPPRALVHGTNGLLPDDIRVMRAETAADSFHARRSARAKRYRYRLVRATVLSPLEALFRTRVDPDLDVQAITAATPALVGEHDFSAFAIAGGAHRSPVRRLFELHVEEQGDRVDLVFVGDGFLRGMVRSIVGTLLEIGRGRRPPDDLPDLLRGRPRSAAGPTAPAHGLTLERVFYGDGWQRGLDEDADLETDGRDRTLSL